MREHGVGAVHRRRPPAGRARSTCSASSFSTELGYTNLLTALDLAGIPLHAARPRRARTRSSSPAGTRRSTPSRSPTSSTPRCSATASRSSARSPTSCATGSPRAARRPRRAAAAPGRDRRASTSRASTTSTYLPDGRIGSVTPNRAGVPERVAKHTVMNLDEWPYPKTPLVPLAETVHERMSVEIFRGCTRGCRFCQAGMITRPVRERSITGIGEMVAARPRRDRLRGGRPALAVQRRPLRDRRDHQATGRPLRATSGSPVAAVHPGRRVQHRPGQRALPQRPPLRPDLRARGRQRAAAPGDQQDGQQGRPDPHGHDGLRQRLASGEALLHVRTADRDRRGRPRDRRDGARRDPGRPRGDRQPRHPVHRVASAGSCPSRTPRSSGRRRPHPRWSTTGCASCGRRSARTGRSAATSACATTTASPRSSRDCSRAVTAGSAP